MKRNQFSAFLASKTGVSAESYEQLFDDVENKYNVQMEDYTSQIESYPPHVQDKLPDTFGEVIRVNRTDEFIATELGASEDAIAGLRGFAQVLHREVESDNPGIDLSNLSDKQKTYLTQLSYLDLNDEAKEILASGGSIKVSDLEQYLRSPDDQFCGNVVIDRNISKAGADMMFGEGSVVTERQLLHEIQSAGLGEISIDAAFSDRSSGFQAMAFSDTEGNRGISYRGSDFNYTSGGLADWMIADGGEWLTDRGMQQRQALRFFEEYANEDGNNYVYGHSLGGNLTSHTFLKHHEDIQEAFTIDGTPINSREIRTEAQLAAFNSDKYNANIVAGDIVGNLKSHDGYEENITYVANNGSMPSNFITAHLVQSATYDEDGNFVTVTREQAVEKMNWGEKVFVDAAQNVKGFMNDASDRFESSAVGQWIIGIRDDMQTYGAQLGADIKDGADDALQYMTKAYEELENRWENFKDDLDAKFDFEFGD